VLASRMNKGAIANWAQVMMEVGVTCVLTGDKDNAITFFRDAAELFRARHDYQSVSVAQGWLKALTQRHDEPLHP
jgi:hypothetical protein